MRRLHITPSSAYLSMYDATKYTIENIVYSIHGKNIQSKVFTQPFDNQTPSFLDIIFDIS